MNKKMRTKTLTFLAASLSVASIAAVSKLAFTTDVAAAETSEMSFDVGASVRTVPDSMGIRFSANYSAELYARVEAGKEVGMIIVPAQALATLSTNEDIFDHLTGEGGENDVDYGKAKENVSTQFVQSQFTENADGTYKAYGAIVDIQDENLSYDYQAVAYYVNDDGAYVYSAYSDTRSISEVTQATIEDTDVTGDDRADVLKMASALSEQLKVAGKTASSEITFKTDGLEGLDLALYEVEGSFEIASATLGEKEITVKDDGTVMFTSENVSDEMQTLSLTYNDAENTTLTFNVNAPKAERTGAKVFEYSVFDYAAYEANGTYSFKTAADPVFGEDYNQYSDQTPVSVTLGGTDILENGKLNLTKVYPNNTYTNFGTEKTLVIDTGVATWTYQSVGYTLVLTEVKHVQNWVKISYGLSTGGYSNGYFVLGNNITSDEVWTYTSDYAVKDADATKADSVCDDYIFAYNTASGTWRGFGGVFDGRGYYIDKMNIVANEASSKGQGFVPALTGTVKNVAFTNSKFSVSAAEWYGFVTTFNAGTVTDVYVDVELVNVSAATIQPTFGVFTALAVNSNKANVTRCVAQVAYNTDSTTSQFTYGSSGIVAVRSGSFGSIEDIFSITNLHANVSYGTLNATRQGGFQTATAMAAATANAYKTNFVTNVANSVWTVDSQGLPYFASMGATPYTY